MTFISWSIDFALYLENCKWVLCHEVKVRMTYISWSNDFAEYFEDSLMEECYIWDIWSVWLKEWPHKIYMGQWLIFQDPVVLPYICKTIWWMNDILRIINKCKLHKDWPHKRYVGQWPICHGPMIMLIIWYIKWWHRPGVICSLQALAVVV